MLLCVTRILELRLLEALRAVAHAGTFTAAADELGLSQSAVTRAVQDLERRVGARLLVRGNRGLRLTPEGEQALLLADQLLTLHDGGLARLQRYREGEGGRLVLSTIPSCAASLLPGLVSSFTRRWPDAEVVIRDGLATNVLEDVRSGVADLGVAPVSPDLPLDGLQAAPLLSDAMQAVFPPDHPAAALPSVTWADLVDDPFIRLSRDSSVRQLTDRGFAMAGRAPTKGYEAGNIVTVGGLVAAGLGVSAVPALVLNVLRFAGVVARPLLAPHLERTVAAVVATGPPPAPVARRFLAHLRNQRVPAPEGSTWIEDPVAG